MKYIQNGWASYLKVIVPKNAGATQIEETKQAFFGGAAVLLTTMLNAMSGDTEATESDLQFMTDLHNELDAFGSALDKKILKPTVN